MESPSRLEPSNSLYLSALHVWFHDERFEFLYSLALWASKYDAVRHEFEQAGSELQVELRLVCASHLERPAEVRFSSSLQAKGFFASVLR
jgi:hypothetical protein